MKTLAATGTDLNVKKELLDIEIALLRIDVLTGLRSKELTNKVRGVLDLLKAEVTG